MYGKKEFEKFNEVTVKADSLLDVLKLAIAATDADFDADTHTIVVTVAKHKGATK